MYDAPNETELETEHEAELESEPGRLAHPVARESLPLALPVALAPLQPLVKRIVRLFLGLRWLPGSSARS